MKLYKRQFKEDVFPKLPVGFINKNNKILEVNVGKTFKKLVTKNIKHIYSCLVEYSGYQDIIFDHADTGFLNIIEYKNFVFVSITATNFLAAWVTRKNIMYKSIEFKEAEKVLQKYNIPLLINKY